MVNLEILFLITIPKMVYAWHEPSDLWLCKSKQLFWCLSRSPVKLFPYNTTDFYQILFWTKLSFVHLQVYFNQEEASKRGEKVNPLGQFEILFAILVAAQRRPNHHHHPPFPIWSSFPFWKQDWLAGGKNWVLHWPLKTFLWAFNTLLAF